MREVESSPEPEAGQPAPPRVPLAAKAEPDALVLGTPCVPEGQHLGQLVQDGHPKLLKRVKLRFVNLENLILLNLRQSKMRT